ncbi:MAG: peptidoglycan editing factor PgeF [Pseudomonadota bacterium]
MTPPFLKAENFGAAIAHGFFGRQGGISEPPFDTLNTGPFSSDDPDCIIENRRRCVNAIGADAAKLITLKQVHSATVVKGTEPFRDAPEADALVSATPGLVLGVLTADCMPLLFVDLQARVAGACHAGWRGACAGVIGATVKEMVALGAKADRIHAALGPCLRQPNFEVGMDLVAAFTGSWRNSSDLFAPGATSEKRLFNLAGFAARQLEESGVNSFTDLNICTLGSNEAYFSYRASQRLGATDYGRNLSIIVTP